MRVPNDKLLTSRAEPSRAEPSRAEPSRAEPDYPVRQYDDMSASDYIRERVSPFIVALYRAAREVPADRYKEWAFEQLHRIIAFDSGIWLNGTMEFGPQVHGMHLHRQPVEMMVNYERVKGDDVLAHKVAEHPGVTWDLFRIVPQEEWVESAAYTEHCRVYGIEQAISTAVVDLDSGLITFMSLYRENADNPFSEQDRVTKEMLVPHLCEAHRTCLFLHLLVPAGIAKAGIRGIALCDQMGVIHQAEHGFPDLLRREWPNWKGPVLPEGVIQQIHNVQSRYEGEQLNIEVQPLDDLFQVVIWPRSPVHVLSPRDEAWPNYWPLGWHTRRLPGGWRSRLPP